MGFAAKFAEHLPQTVQSVRFLFEQYASGVPMKDIIGELTRRGVRGSRGGALTYNTFSRVLTNTTYIGQYKYKGNVVPDLAEPMIDADLFGRTQAVVKANAHAPAANKAEVDYLLQGKAFCGKCGWRVRARQERRDILLLCLRKPQKAPHL